MVESVEPNCWDGTVEVGERQKERERDMRALAVLNVWELKCANDWLQGQIFSQNTFIANHDFYFFSRSLNFCFNLYESLNSYPGRWFILKSLHKIISDDQSPFQPAANFQAKSHYYKSYFCLELFNSNLGEKHFINITPDLSSPNIVPHAAVETWRVLISQQQCLSFFFTRISTDTARFAFFVPTHL